MKNGMIEDEDFLSNGVEYTPKQLVDMVRVGHDVAFFVIHSWKDNSQNPAVRIEKRGQVLVVFDNTRVGAVMQKSAVIELVAKRIEGSIYAKMIDPRSLSI